MIIKTHLFIQLRIRYKVYLHPKKTTSKRCHFNKCTFFGIYLFFIQNVINSTALLSKFIVLQMVCEHFSMKLLLLFPNIHFPLEICFNVGKPLLSAFVCYFSLTQAILSKPLRVITIGFASCF